MLKPAKAGKCGVERLLFGDVACEQPLHENFVSAFAGCDGFETLVKCGMAAIDPQYTTTFLKGREKRGLQNLDGLRTLEILCVQCHGLIFAGALIVAEEAPERGL